MEAYSPAHRESATSVCMGNFRHVKERYTANFISVSEVARLKIELIFKWAAGPEHKVAASSGS